MLMRAKSDRLLGQFWIKPGVDAVGADRREHQRVAVARAARNELGRDVVVRACHDERLTSVNVATSAGRL